jgi:hypothetical protein
MIVSKASWLNRRPTASPVEWVPCLQISGRKSGLLVYMQYLRYVKRVVSYTSNPPLPSWRGAWLSKGKILLAYLLSSLKALYVVKETYCKQLQSHSRNTNTNDYWQCSLPSFKSAVYVNTSPWWWWNNGILVIKCTSNNSLVFTFLVVTRHDQIRRNCLPRYYFLSLGKYFPVFRTNVVTSPSG